MAVNRDDLSIKISVESGEAKKNLQVTASSVKELEKSLKLVSDSFKESFLQSSNNSRAYAEASKVSAALNKSISSVVKTSDTLASKNKDLANSYSDINKKSNSQSMQEVSKIYNDLQKTTGSLDKATTKLNETLEETSNITRTIIPQTGVELVGSFDSTAGEIDETNSTLKDLNRNITETNSGINSQISHLNSLNSTLGSVSSSINSVTTVYHTFLSDASLKKASNLLSILSSIADIKGFNVMAESFKKASEQIDKMNAGLEKFRAMSNDNFETTEEKLSLLNQAIKIMNFSLIATGVTIGGVFAGQALGVIPQWSEMFSKISSTLENVRMGAIKAGEVFRGTFRLSMLSVVEATTLLSPGLFLLGSSLQESENAFVRATGTMIKFASVLMGGVGSAITYLMSLLSGLIVSLGQWMVRSLIDAEEKFRKFEVTMRQFSFVIKGFNKEVGEDAVGSLKLWERQLDKIVETSNFTRSEVAKSIKLLVAEGSILGLSVEQNTKLLQLSADVAAATGNNLEEVTQRILTSISQNASAVLGLGIDIREHNLEHSEFLKQSGLAVKQLTKEQQVQLRLAAVFEKSVPLLGAAADATETIEGANLRLTRSMDELLVVYGEQANYTKMLIIFKTKLIETLLMLPKPLISFIGTMQDFVGTVLIVVGSILKWTFTLLGLVLAFKFLNSVLTTYLGITISVSSIMGVILKRIVPLIGFIMVMQKSWEELNDSSTQFSKTLVSLGRNMGLIADKSQEVAEDVGLLSQVLSKIFGAAVSGVKVILTGLVQTMLMTQIAYLQLKKLFSSSEDEKIYEMIINDIDLQLNQLTADLGPAYKALNIFSNGSAVAAETLDNFGQSLKDNRTVAEQFRDRVEAAAKVINKGFDESIERQKVMGDEFEKSSVTILETANKIKNVFSEKSSEEDTATKLAELQIKLINDKLQAEKLSFDTLKEIEKQGRDLKIEALKASGKNIEAIRLEYDERRKLLDLQVEGVRKLGALSPKQIAMVENVKAGLKKAAAAAAMGTGTENKVEQLTKEYQALNAENIDARMKVNSLYQNEFELIQSQMAAALQKNKIEIDALSLQEEAIKKNISIGESMGASTEELEKQKKILELTNKIKGERIVSNEIITDDSKNKVAAASMGIANGIIGAMGSSANALVGQIINTIGTMFGPIGQIVAGLINVFRNGYDFMKNLGTELVNIIVELPLMLAEGVVGLVEGLLEALVNTLADPEKLGRILTAFTSMIPKVIGAIARALPGIIKAIFSVKFWAEMISSAFVALRDSIFGMFGSIKNMFKNISKNITTGFVDGVKAGMDTLAGFGQRVFAVVADVAGMASGQEAGTGPGKSIEDTMRKANTWWINFKKEFSAFFKGLFNGIVDIIAYFLDVFGEIIKMVFSLPKFIIDAVVDIGKFLFEGLKQLPGFLIDSVKGLGEALWYAISSLGDIVKSVIIDPIVGIGSAIWDGIKGIGSSIKSLFTDIFSFGDSQGTVEGWISKAIKTKFDIPVLRFAEGGNVPGNAKVFGDSYKNDTVPALLSPGEFVLPRSITQDAKMMKWIMSIVETGKPPEMHFKGLSDVGKGLKKVGEVTGVNKVIEKVTDVIPPELKEIYSWVTDNLGKIDLKTFIKNPIGSVIDLVQNSIGGYIEPRIGGMMESIIGNTKFHSGGLVGNYAFGGEVPALLQPGEFVMNRRAVSNIGESNLGNMNLGRSGFSGGDTTINISLNIDTEQPIDEAFIRSKLIPSLKKELKESSLRGEFVLSQKGLR